MSNADPIRMTADFEGKVQGVGFRAAVRTFAKELALAGSARNLPDGTVKVIVQGSKARCETLVKKLKDRFDVTDIMISFSSAEESSTDFLAF